VRLRVKKEFQVCLNFGSQHLLTKPQTPNSKLHNRKIYTTGKYTQQEITQHTTGKEKRKIYISMSRYKSPNSQQQITQHTTGKEKRKIYISMNAQQQITKPQTPYKNREKENKPK
jgi:hypothetical protein